MIGKQQITLTNASVREALEEYFNRHLKPEHQQKVEAWIVTPNNYGTVTLDIALVAPGTGTEIV